MQGDYLPLRFSHRTYHKLKEIDVEAAVTLLEVFLAQRKYLGKTFLEYDTTYDRNDGKTANYAIGSERVLVLLFRDRNGRIFTTVRPQNPQKLRYYSNSKGKLFKIIFD